MFIKEAEVCNFADDNSLHASDPSVDNVKTLLEKGVNKCSHLVSDQLDGCQSSEISDNVSWDKE